MLRDEEIDEVIGTLERHFAQQLTDWEQEFLVSVKEQWTRRRQLSSRQRDKLDEIMERCARSYGR